MVWAKVCLHDYPFVHVVFGVTGGTYLARFAPTTLFTPRDTGKPYMCSRGSNSLKRVTGDDMHVIGDTRLARWRFGNPMLTNLSTRLVGSLGGAFSFTLDSSLLVAGSAVVTLDF